MTGLKICNFDAARAKIQLYLSFLVLLSSAHRVCLVGLGFQDDPGNLVPRCVVVAFTSHHIEREVKSLYGVFIDVN